MASKACNWYITARAGYKIFLNFELFGVEGDPPSKLISENKEEET
jgi:hypothetical protein